MADERIKMKDELHSALMNLFSCKKSKNGLFISSQDAGVLWGYIIALESDPLRINALCAVPEGE